MRYFRLSGVVTTPSAKASIGRESARNRMVRSYHFSFFLLNAAQSMPSSSASTGTVKLWVPSASSVNGM